MCFCEGKISVHLCMFSSFSWSSTKKGEFISLLLDCGRHILLVMTLAKVEAGRAGKILSFFKCSDIPWRNVGQGWMEHNPPCNAECYIFQVGFLSICQDHVFFIVTLKPKRSEISFSMGANVCVYLYKKMKLTYFFCVKTTFPIIVPQILFTLKTVCF